jgi:hypothetical protein
MVLLNYGVFTEFNFEENLEKSWYEWLVTGKGL